MNIGEVLTRAWDIIWKNKILWIFGLFAALAGGSGGNNYNYNIGRDGGINHIPFNIPVWGVALLVLLALVLFVALVVLATLGRAGLVRGAWLADGGESNLTFSRLFRESQPYFGRVLLLGILFVAISIGIVLVLIVPTVLTCGIITICLVPFFIVLSMLVELAVVAIVGENKGVVESLQRAWEIVRGNLALVIAVGFVIVIASAVISFLAGLPLMAITAPVIIYMSSNSGQLSSNTFFVALFLFLLYLPILLSVQAILTTYVETTWTVAFRRLTGRAADGVVTPTGETPMTM